MGYLSRKGNSAILVSIENLNAQIVDWTEDLHVTDNVVKGNANEHNLKF